MCIRDSFQPFISDFTNWKLNAGKTEKTILEAVEQCERMDLPSLEPLIPLEKMLQQSCFVAVERSDASSQIQDISSLSDHPVLVVGPEGGFSVRERQLISRARQCQTVSLGGSILRAETAGLAGICLLQARRGLM